ncbi:peroxin 20 [Phyllosticta paracitricarpa]|uniref:Peroxin 20 n=1 Tax=Phyllosticta paracitricarpa TaxID=2016321 RepID=A0ABR1MV51_9PEZI
MSDALCGPSNALQNFQKHSSVDRTLQQDRLVSRPSPSQNFRSNSAQNAGILDPEFEAFQAGRPHDGMHLPPHSIPQPNLTGPPGLPDWAADFQRLHVSSPPPAIMSPQSRFQPQASSHNYTTSWSNDFLRQQPQSPASRQISHTPNTSMYTGAPMLGWANGPLHQHQPFTSAQGNLNSPAPSQQHAQVAPHDAAFERAFEQAHADLLNAEKAQSSPEQTGSSRESQDLGVADALERAQAEEQAALGGYRTSEDILEAVDSFSSSRVQRDSQQPNIDPVTTEAREPEVRHVDAREDAQQEQQHVPNQEDEELARTAGQLLDSVSHDTSEKFQQSNFLALMRKLRDYEVRVDGDKVVEVSTTPSPSLIPPLAFDGYVEWMQEQAKQLLSVRHHHHNHHYTPTSDVTCKVFGCSLEHHG